MAKQGNQEDGVVVYIIFFLIQLALVVHVFKTGRNLTWAFILLLFPLIGGLAYLFVELIPEWMDSKAARHTKRSIKQVMDPDKALREAYQNVEVSDTVQNMMTLAEQCLNKEHYEEAKELYQRCLTNIYADDPFLMLGLAKSYFGLKEYKRTISQLDELIRKNPDFKSSDGHLLYACAQENAGHIAAAINEYETLINYYPGPEPACRLGLLFKSQGHAEQANDLFEKIVKKSKTLGNHYNNLNKKWIAIAKRELQGS